jgi:hypothetical protein
MDTLFRVSVISASVGLRSLLRATCWQGSIAAVFHNSLLCATSDGRLIHLHTGPRLLSPFSLRLAGDFANVLREAPIVPGMPVRKTNGAVEISAHLLLRLDDVSYYQSPGHLVANIEPDALGIARHLLRAHGRPGGFDQMPAAPGLVTAIQYALAARHAPQLLAAARQLIGLGPGLTPSGDDFLVGYLRGLWLLDWKDPGVSYVLSRVREALLGDLDVRTTRVGAEFIRYAIDGAFGEVLDQAALSLLAPSHPPALQSALGQLLAQGETSGTDTTLGFLTCLESLSPSPPREPRQPWYDTSVTALAAVSTSAAPRA